MKKQIVYPIHESWQVFMIGKNVYTREGVRVMRIGAQRKRPWRPDLTGFTLLRGVKK